MKTNKNSIKIIIWLVVGGSSDNFYLRLSLCKPKLHNIVFAFLF
jgi:hypothetical protein